MQTGKNAASTGESVPSRDAGMRGSTKRTQVAIDEKIAQYTIGSGEYLLGFHQRSEVVEEMMEQLLWQTQACRKLSHRQQEPPEVVV